MLTGNLTYTFDQASLDTLFNGNTTKIKDFKNRMDAAAQDWATKTGRTITRASSGTGDVTIGVNGSVTTSIEKGSVSVDPVNNSRRKMIISDD
jgi:hypothetical protein